MNVENDGKINTIHKKEGAGHRMTENRYNGGWGGGGDQMENEQNKQYCTELIGHPDFLLSRINCSVRGWQGGRGDQHFAERQKQCSKFLTI